MVRSNERNHLLSYYTNINYETGKKKTEVEHELDANAFKNLNNGSPDSFLGYAKLYKKITGKVFKGNHECIEKDSYRILNINTSILAGSAYDEGNLSVYCGPLLEECKKIKNDDKINIAFMHHGVEFLKKTERRKFEQLMESHYIDIVFSGHSHDIGIRTYDHTGNRMRQFTCGGPLKDGYNKPSFYYCIYDSDTHELKCYLYTYNDEIQDWNLANTERAFKDGKCSFILPRFQKKSKYFDTTRDRELDGRKNLQDDYLKQFGIVAALPLKEFIRKRNVMIQNAKGNIILAGQSLENAFDIREDNESIVNSIKHNKNIKNIDIFLTDPIMFDSATEVEVGDTPISRIGTTMHTILYDIYKELEKDQSINIYFIPLVQLDHMVFVDDLLLLRHTLLWTNDSHYKATPLICKRIDKNSTLDRIIVNSAMYNVYAEYINRLKTDSMVIEIKQYGNSAKNETKAKKSHREWRERLYYLRKSKKLKGQIIMHKLYRSQLISDLHSTWDLKDDEALRFISIARSLNEQNRDIHNWFASEIFGDIKPIQQKTYHHYGMPTDYSIAIGTYVVDERDVVPIFSREGYPIFLFRPSSNMWSIVLEGKTKYIIPHGWGQELRYDYFAKQIQKEDFKNGKLSIKNGKFVLSNSQHGYYEKKFDIDYSARFNKKQVGVRDLYKTDKFDGKNIFGDTPYIKGTIEEILDPVALFSSDTEGAVKYYVSGEEN